MKKILLSVITVLVALVFCVPAMAKLTIGGDVVTDAYWLHRDADFMQLSQGRANDSSQTRFQLHVTSLLTNLHAEWESKDGNVGMYIQFNIGGENSGENVQTDYAYGWWQINDIFKLTVGQSDETLGVLAPAQNMGNDVGLSSGDGFGNVGGDFEPRVQLTARLTDNFTLDVSAVYPSLNTQQVFVNGLGVAATWNAAEEETCMPKFEVMLTCSFGPVTIYPSYMYYKAKYARDAGSSANVLAATDDEIMAYAWSIPVEFSYGPFSVSAEYTMGENLGAAGGGGAGALAFAWDNTSGTAVVYNSEVNAFWIDVAYTISPMFEIHGIWGMQDEELDRPGLANDLTRERDMWGIVVPINVAPHFTIAPQYFVFDYGDQEDGGVNLGGLGKETIAGIQFTVSF